MLHGDTTMVMPQVLTTYGKTYFVVNLETAKTTTVNAHTQEEACYFAGWWFVDCFARLLVPDVTYPLQHGV